MLDPCTVLHNIRMVLKQKIVAKHQKSNLIYTSQGKIMILPGAKTSFSISLFYLVILINAKTLRSVFLKTFSRAFKNSPKLNTDHFA